MLRIGTIVADPGLLLAPMEDVSDLPFRLICKELGADIVYTEFVNAEGLVRSGPEGSRRTASKLQFLPRERPLGIQLYGASEVTLEAAAEIANAHEPDLIDINCGCWVSNVALRGAGAGLLKDLPRLRRVAQKVVRATSLPVTVKTRLGWDAESIHILEVAKMLEDAGIQALAVHCRTRAQGHKGTVDYGWIPRLKNAVSMPIILNGDVREPQDVERCFRETGCDAVMIGRGAIAHPWLFRDARHYLSTGELLPSPPLQERAYRCLRHLDLAVEHLGVRAAIVGMRRHYSGYFRGLNGAAQLRAELVRCRELAPLRARIQQLGDDTHGEDSSRAA
jgi:tRNA-dihydrouridine synthase B